MTQPNTNKSCPYSSHSGPVGFLPAPNIFPLAKETFAKGKMFWNKLKGDISYVCSVSENPTIKLNIFIFGLRPF